MLHTISLDNTFLESVSILTIYLYVQYELVLKWFFTFLFTLNGWHSRKITGVNNKVADG